MRRQGNMAQMKEQDKTPDKELNETETANLSDEEFKKLVIRMLRELIEYGKNIREEMKVTVSEIKKNLQGTNSEREEAGIKSTIWSMRKKQAFNKNVKKKTEFKKMRTV